MPFEHKIRTIVLIIIISLRDLSEGTYENIAHVEVIENKFLTKLLLLYSCIFLFLDFMSSSDSKRGSVVPLIDYTKKQKDFDKSIFTQIDYKKVRLTSTENDRKKCY